MIFTNMIRVFLIAMVLLVTGCATCKNERVKTLCGYSGYIKESLILDRHQRTASFQGRESTIEDWTENHVSWVGQMKVFDGSLKTVMWRYDRNSKLLEAYFADTRERRLVCSKYS